MSRVHLVGESNPYGADPDFALYPLPAQSAGGRLCRKVLGMREVDYLKSFDRYNLLLGAKWSVSGAERSAADLARSFWPDDLVVLLGRRVFEAFRGAGHLQFGEWVPFTAQRAVESEPWYLLFPHPSGLSRVWNDPESVPLARASLLLLAPHLEGLVGRSDG